MTLTRVVRKDCAPRCGLYILEHLSKEKDDEFKGYFYEAENIIKD